MQPLTPSYKVNQEKCSTQITSLLYNVSQGCKQTNVKEDIEVECPEEQLMTGGATDDRSVYSELKSSPFFIL